MPYKPISPTKPWLRQRVSRAGQVQRCRPRGLRTGTIMIQAVFPNPRNILRPGQYAKIRVVTKQKKALLVPQRAVQELQGNYQVAVVGPDSTVEFRPVEVGEKVGSQWVIEKRLHPHERVVVAGLQKVTAGAVVQAKPLPADTASTVAANTTVQGQ